VKVSQRLTKDQLGAALLVLLGIGVSAAGVSYRIGTLTNMGAGFLPFALGILLVVIGMTIGATSRPAAQPDAAPLPPEWRGWACILLAVLAFVIVGQYGGLVPAMFLTVFIGALGDRKNSLRDAFLLAVAVTIFGTLVFGYGLSVQMSLFSWG
jgi:hypothetical protein